MKGLILAGGLGTRLRPLTHTGPKQLIPIANKPVLHYIVEDMASSGITDIGVIVGYTEERINSIKESLGDGSRWNVRIDYIEQDAPRGLAHAVYIAKGFLGKESFVVYLGDNIMKSGIKKFIDEFVEAGADISLLLSQSHTPEKFGVAYLNSNEIVRVDEKPKNPESNLVITGVYIFNQKIFDYIETITPSGRGELEITHAIQKAVESGKHRITAHIVDGWWDDTGTAEDILHANRMILHDLKTSVKGIAINSSITGNVEIGENSVVDNAVLRGPVKIGINCTVKNSYIGPYTSIGDNTVITSGEIESSIIMGGSKIDIGDKRIFDSLVGKNVKIESNRSFPRGCKFVIGEDSEIKL